MIVQLRHLVLNFCLLFFSFLSLQAQIKVNSEVDVTEYPSVSFDIYNRNPNFKKESSYDFFKIKNLNEVRIDSISMVQVSDTINYSKKNKCVLILIESINNEQRIEQVNTFFRAVENSLSKFVNPGDKIQIATFHSWQDNNLIINTFHTNFTDDI